MKILENIDLQQKQLVAWGAGPTFDLIRKNDPGLNLMYLVDRQANTLGDHYLGLPVIAPEKMTKEFIKKTFFVITAHSAGAIRSIFDQLSAINLKFGEDFADYSYICHDRIANKATQSLLKLDKGSFAGIHSSVMSGRVDLETTITGVWILDALIQNSFRSGKNAVAEVGAFRCGNAMIQSSRMRARHDMREYHVFDSFEGFGKLDVRDPQHLAGAYTNEMYDYPLTMNLASLHPGLRINKGFVPDVFKVVPREQQYDLVFFDCDLYQPCLDTFEFFWSRMSSNSFFVIHDYVTYDRGWTGVSEAVAEIAKSHGLNVSVFWESTMAIIQKT